MDKKEFSGELNWDPPDEPVLLILFDKLCSCGGLIFSMDDAIKFSLMFLEGLMHVLDRWYDKCHSRGEVLHLSGKWSVEFFKDALDQSINSVYNFKLSNITQGIFNSFLITGCQLMFADLVRCQNDLQDVPFEANTAWDRLCVAAFNGKGTLCDMTFLISSRTFKFPQSLSQMTSAEIVNSFAGVWCWVPLKYTPSLHKFYTFLLLWCSQLYHLVSCSGISDELQWCSLNLATGYKSVGSGISMHNYQRIFYRSIVSCVSLFEWFLIKFNFKDMVDILEKNESKEELQFVRMFAKKSGDISGVTVKRLLLFVFNYQKLSSSEKDSFLANFISKSEIYSLSTAVIKKMCTCKDGSTSESLESNVFGNHKFTQHKILDLLNAFDLELDKWYDSLVKKLVVEIKDQCVGDGLAEQVDDIMEDDDCKSLCDFVDGLTTDDNFVEKSDKCSLNLFKWLLFAQKDQDPTDDIKVPELTVDEVCFLMDEFDHCRREFSWICTLTRYGCQYECGVDAPELLGFVWGWWYFLVHLIHFKPNLEELSIRTTGTTNKFNDLFVHKWAPVSENIVTLAWSNWLDKHKGEIACLLFSTMMIFFGQFELKLKEHHTLCTKMNKDLLKAAEEEGFVAQAADLELNPQRSSLKKNNEKFRDHKSKLQNIKQTGCVNVEKFNKARQSSMNFLMSWERNPTFGYKPDEFMGVNLIMCSKNVGQWWGDQQSSTLKQQFSDWEQIQWNKYHINSESSGGVESRVLQEHGIQKNIRKCRRTHSQHPSKPQNENENTNENKNKNENDDEEDDIDILSDQIKQCGKWKDIENSPNDCVSIVNLLLNFVLDNVEGNKIVLNANSRISKVNKFVILVSKIHKNDVKQLKQDLNDGFTNNNLDKVKTFIKNMINEIKKVKPENDKFVLHGCNCIAVVGILLVLPRLSGENFVNCSYVVNI